MNGPESTSRWHFPEFVAEIHSQQIDEVHLQPQIRVSKNRIDLQPQIIKAMEIDQGNPRPSTPNG